MNKDALECKEEIRKKKNSINCEENLYSPTFQHSINHVIPQEFCNP